MTIQLQMLGTGSAFAKTYLNNNAILHTTQHAFLIDCGITAPMAVHQLGKSFNEFDGVIVTHLHADHVGGLEEYAFQMKFRYKRKPKLYIAASLVDMLWENTLKGGMSQDGINKLDDVFDVLPMEPELNHPLAADLQVKWVKTDHMPGKNSYSLLINERFFYTADMRFNFELLQSLVDNGVEHIWHDCQLIGTGEVHSTIHELLSLPIPLQQRISLMHYGDERPQWEGRTGPMTFINQHQIYTLM
ncbi:MBL fold metallo-hydrolase [Paenibacillus sp. ACRRX]|uniref:MBL fold metallo-hydrolase n=1 Tax=Paenibacillus sp. ACRRX TaxID=2918206 RepID=UPI001EF703C0|nr:MBL fold metallo-hydrolase [Paenibacillus sp. ACRRX]MCG7407660.1 MBL fold metallo-hydrolase [Paenibacillus sp. ACRRX]